MACRLIVFVKLRHTKTQISIGSLTFKLNTYTCTYLPFSFHILILCIDYSIEKQYLLMGLLHDTCMRMRREWQEHFPAADSKRNRLLAIPACITARASCKCRDACRGRLTRDNGENVPGIPGAYATRSFTYLARGPWRSWYWSLVNWQTHNGNHWLIFAMTMISDPIIFVVIVLTISFVFR